jgi:predicted DNA binding CopG/RHH family protein
MKKKFVIPKFKNEAAEHKFWEKIDLSEYASDFKHFNLDELLSKYAEPKSTRVTIRIPTEVVKSYKAKAKKLDVPYQSLMKQQLAKGL